jgi:hypothetical protein
MPFWLPKITFGCRRPYLHRPVREWDWDTFGVHIKSHINEFVVNSRIGWFGNGTGMRAYHTWYLIPKGKNRTFVVMEECVYGAGARDLRQKDPAVMHRGHELWDTTLKALSETN